jgi:hypothetical protein
MHFKVKALVRRIVRQGRAGYISSAGSLAPALSTVVGLVLAVCAAIGLARSETLHQAVPSADQRAEAVVTTNPERGETVFYLVSNQAQVDQAWAIERYAAALQHDGQLDRGASYFVILKASSADEEARVRSMVEDERGTLEGQGGRVTVIDWLGTR